MSIILCLKGQTLLALILRNQDPILREAFRRLSVYVEVRSQNVEILTKISFSFLNVNNDHLYPIHLEALPVFLKKKCEWLLFEK